MKLIACLGNPGDKYIKSRHNAGWIFIDNHLGDVTWEHNKKFNALVYRNSDLIYLKPLTFMNNSGLAVRRALDYYKLMPKKFGLITKQKQDLSSILLVIHDDLDLNFNQEKLSLNSGSAGHRGVESVINHLKTKNFSRLRLGIKNDSLRQQIPPQNFVLQNFSEQELTALEAKAKTYSLEQFLSL